MIGRGTHGTVSRDPDSGIVCKRFELSDRAESAEQAQREFDYLARFSAALSAEPFLNCPEPIRVQPEDGLVWMAHCPGVPLDTALADPSMRIDRHMEHIVEQIDTALETYIREFDEPYYDLAPKNMLFDAATGILSLVDFTSRRRVRNAGSAETAVETSLACLIGISTYDAVRPALWRNRVYQENQRALAAGLIQRMSEKHRLQDSLIRTVSASIYGHSAKRGRIARRLWYSTVGQILFKARVNAILRVHSSSVPEGR